MKTKINRPAVWAAALCALALVGCDSVKDVRSTPSTALPKDKEVLAGVIYGLGGGRSITLKYGNAATAVAGFFGPDPAAPTTEPAPLPFSFGSLDVGTEYNVVVSVQPFGKTCAPDNSATGATPNTGTLTKGTTTNIVIRCTNSIPRYDLTVQIPPTPAVFSGLTGAKVYLKTGEWMQAKTVASGATSVTFPGALYSAVGQNTAFTYTVSASFIDPEGNESRCRVTNPTGTNPGANVTSPIVGASATTTQLACQFTMSGSVAYSVPPGGTTETGAIPGGMLLEVRDAQAKVKASYTVTDYGDFTIGGTTNPTLFSSNINSIYDIVVARQPNGRICVVGDGGGTSLYRTGTNNPTDITKTAAAGAVANTRAWGSRLNVFCRTKPVAGRELSGVYRLTSSSYTPAQVLATTANPNPPAPVTSTVTYNAYDWTQQNLGSSNMLTFFDDGTFLYGTHGSGFGNLLEAGVTAGVYSVQVEHGFYDYDPTAKTLRFTLITDTDPSVAYPPGSAGYPPGWGPVGGTLVTQNRSWTSGLSASPGGILNGTPAAGAGTGIWTAAMNNVTKSTASFNLGRSVAAPQTLRRITGTFGTGTDPRLSWELTEPQSVNNEMTGTWIARDHRRSWVWDYLTYFGTNVSVVGGAPSMNDACFTMADVEAAVGIYTRRGTSTLCLPLNRPSRTTTASYLIGFTEAVDFHLTNVTASTNTFTGVAGLNNYAAPPCTAPATASGSFCLDTAGNRIFANVTGSRLVPQFTGILPGFVGRIPGGNSAADGRSPSPIVYLIANSDQFAAKAASTTVVDAGGDLGTKYFDDLTAQGDFTTWCPGSQILGLRATLHGNPINYPIYLCRTRAAP
jgi:hypothetical protein